MKKKTKEDFYNDLNHEYEIVDNFTNFSTKATIKHLSCGKTWEAKPETLTRKTKPVRCPFCFQKKWDIETVNSFLEEIDIYPLKEFKGIQEKYSFKCKKCGNVWSTSLLNILYNHTKCPECRNTSKKKTHEEFLEEMKNIYGEEYKVIGEYTGFDKPIKILHTICGNEYETTPNNILGSKNRKGRRCPKCFGTPKKNTEEFKKQIEEITSGEYEVIGEYLGNKVKIKMKHKSCGKEFEVRPDNFLSLSTRCPHCNLGSGLQREVSYFLKNCKLEIVENYKVEGYNKELDIFVPSKKIGIEVDGLYWHSENNVGKKYNLDKTEEFRKRGIRVIHIFEDEWTFKKDIVKSKLKRILGVEDSSLKSLYARKCSIREISSKEKGAFLDKFHIQGNDNSQLKLGAYYNNELVAVMTFCKGRLGIGHNNSKSDIYELSRFATNSEYRIIGVFGKLLSHAHKNYNINHIISYADLRWSSQDKNIYTENGFTEICINKPNYWYFVNRERFHRFSFRKTMLKEKFPDLYSPDLTEFQIMDKTKYKRIWDCGTIKYEKRL